MEKKKYSISITSENAPGTLYRIAGTLLRKKINIEELHVKEIDPRMHLSKFAITIFLDKENIEKLVRQLERIIEVVCVEYWEAAESE